MWRLFTPDRIEPLEPRVAPAVIIAPGGHSAQFIDVDGDRVVITVSKGTLSAALALKGKTAEEIATALGHIVAEPTNPSPPATTETSTSV